MKFMVKLSCKDVSPDSSCDFEVSGNSNTDVAKKMLDHAVLEHSDDVKDMTDAEMMEMFENKAHS